MLSHCDCPKKQTQVYAVTKQDIMASILLSQTGPNGNSQSAAPSGFQGWMDACGFANAAIEFAALGIIAQKGRAHGTHYHLFALSIELAFKSLALRFGATPAQCKKACGHKLTEMIKLCESLGAKIPKDLKRQLSNDEWFKKMLDTRYPVFVLSPTIKETLFVHSNYPQLIANILSIDAPVILTFDGGGAYEEIRKRFTSRNEQNSSQRNRTSDER